MPVRRVASEGRSYVYGPVPSRRLGFSLGVDILPFKTCTLDCIYCQLGPSAKTTARRGDFVPVREVLAQIRKAVRSSGRIDHITFSGSGEPTLNRSIGRIIREIKKTTPIPVAVLTNGTLLHRRDVREDLLQADIVVPSFDAATAGILARVNRPHPSIRLERMMRGLAEFRKEFKGRIWLEIMLVAGVNDSPAHLREIRKVLAVIRPDRIHLNTVVRPPAERTALPLGRKEMERVRRALGGNCEIVADFPERKKAPAAVGLSKAVLSMVRRRPVTAEDIASSLGRDRDEVLKSLAALLEAGKLRRIVHRRKTYFEPA